MGSKHRLSRVLQVVMLAPVFTGLLLMGFTWMHGEYARFLEESAAIAARLESEQRHRLVDEVANAADYILFKVSQAEARLRLSIRQRTYEACAIAQNIQDNNLDKPRETVAKMITDALRPIRFNSGRGYYFATDMQGYSFLFADKPELEGSYLGDLLTLEGRSVVKDQIEICRTQGEGFYHYVWTKPHTQGRHHRKIAFVKYFEPLDWYIGTGEYLDDVEADIQKEVVERLEKIRFGPDGYVFAGQYDGVSLSGPAKGKNMLDVQDANGVHIVRELIAAAKAGGGFVAYTMPPLDGKKSAPKLSYAQGIPQWQWYVGAGVYQADIAQAVAEKRDALQQDALRSALTVLSILLAVSALAIYLARRVGDKVNRSFSAFEGFFAAAAHGATRMGRELLHYQEFESLAASANEMSDKRRAAEEQARAFRIYLKSVIDSMPSVIVGADSQGRVTSWNREAEAVTAVASAHAMGRPVDELFPMLEGRMDGIAEALDSGEPLMEEKIAWTDMGETTYWNLTVYPLDVGKDREVVIRLDDVTDRVRLEERMIQTEKMVSVGGLAAGMAHEINNPLAGMMQNAQVVLHRLSMENPASLKAAGELGLSMETVHEFMEKRGVWRMLELIRDSGARASAIVENMLAFSKKTSSAFTPCDINQLLDKTVDLASSDFSLAEGFDFRSIRIERRYEDGLPGVPCDPARLQQVILSLLQNAAQAMMPSGSKTPGPVITLKTSREEGMARIEVKDNGPGMDEQTRKRVFEPFFTTKPVGSGTGLGLTVSYFIVTQQHRGTLHVESDPGAGACFIIRLPL